MSIKFSCPGCDKPLTIPDELAGKRRKCPKCGTKFTVPLADGTIPEGARPPTIRDPKKAGAAEAELATDHPLLLMRPMRAHDENLVDMTAMVDIVFFLLIFFLVTSLQSVESVINLPSPQAADSGAGSVRTATDVTNDPKYLVVTIDEDDTVWVGDEKVFGEQALRAKLREAKKADKEKSGMLVVGDADASHGTLVMVLDAGADAGMQDLLFSVREGGEAAGG